VAPAAREATRLAHRPVELRHERRGICSVVRPRTHEGAAPVAPACGHIDGQVDRSTAHGMIEPEGHDELLDPPNQEACPDGPCNQGGAKREIALRSGSDPRLEDMPDIEHERALHELPRLASEASTAAYAAHGFVEIRFVSTLSRDTSRVASLRDCVGVPSFTRSPRGSPATRLGPLGDLQQVVQHLDDRAVPVGAAPCRSAPFSSSGFWRARRDSGAR